VEFFHPSQLKFNILTHTDRLSDDPSHPASPPAALESETTTLAGTISRTDSSEDHGDEISKKLAGVDMAEEPVAPPAVVTAIVA
jgi:hypothetical protein